MLQCHAALEIASLGDCLPSQFYDIGAFSDRLCELVTWLTPRFCDLRLETYARPLEDAQNNHVRILPAQPPIRPGWAVSVSSKFSPTNPVDTARLSCERL